MIKSDAKIMLAAITKYLVGYQHNLSLLHRNIELSNSHIFFPVVFKDLDSNQPVSLLGFSYMNVFVVLCFSFHDNLRSPETGCRFCGCT